MRTRTLGVRLLSLGCWGLSINQDPFRCKWLKPNINLRKLWREFISSYSWKVQWWIQRFGWWFYLLSWPTDKYAGHSWLCSIHTMILWNPFLIRNERAFLAIRGHLVTSKQSLFAPTSRAESEWWMRHDYFCVEVWERMWAQACHAKGTKIPQ